MPYRTLREIVDDQELLHATSDTDVHAAAVRMSERNVAAILVIDGGVLSGIFTERDLLRRVVAAGRDPQKTRLGDVMTTEVACVDAGQPGFEAARVMHDRGIRHVVITGAGNPVGYGVVSVRDFIAREMAIYERELEFEDRLWEEI
ncbi:MAG: CBS domain-containing protein [Rhodospirillales bacterium]